MMSDIQLGVLSLLATLGFYYFSKWAYGRRQVFWRAPVVMVPLSLLGFVLLLDISPETYFRYTHWLVLMLGPATLAFALPIYQQRHIMRRYPLTLLAGVVAGLVLGMLSSWVMAWVLPVPKVVAASMLARTASTPFALPASASLGGIPDLTAMLVILTGLAGMLLCDPAFRLARVKTSLAKGAALGSISHGAGTARAHEINREAGVVASLAMIFTGIAMVLLAPVLARVL